MDACEIGVGIDAAMSLFIALSSDIPVGDIIVGITRVFGLVSVNARSNPIIAFRLLYSVCYCILYI